uniref:Uncharacterized protein n=1 Tax=Anopheles dirus TaxID=7168 RepID=A0A182NMS7_9DIPT
MDSKTEVRSKPILSPTRSLDEGFESDPDRISTDSELATAQTTPAFDVLQRTDRDGVQHTQIARRPSPGASQDSASSVSTKHSGPESIICLEGEIEKELRTKLEKTSLGRPPTGLPKAAITTGGQQIRYRRIKTRAPPPPIGSYYYQKRSASVDSVNRASSASQGPCSLYNLSLDPGSTVNLHLDLAASGPASVAAPSAQPGHDVLAGRFVRVTVDPRHHQSAQPPSSLNQFRLASLYIPTSVASSVGIGGGAGSTGGGGTSRNNLYSLPPQYGLSAAAMASGASPIGSHASSVAAAAAAANAAASSAHSQQSATGSVAISSGPSAGAIGRNYQHFNHVPVCWTQSIPRQTRR